MKEITKEEVEFVFSHILKSKNLMEAYISFIIKRYNEQGEDITSLELKSAVIDMGYKSGKLDFFASRNLFQKLLDVTLVFKTKEEITDFINSSIKEADTMDGKVENHQIITYLKELKYPVKEENRVKLLKYYYLEINKHLFSLDELEDAKDAIKNDDVFIVSNVIEDDRRLLN